MVLWTSLIYMLVTVPYSISFILKFRLSALYGFRVYKIICSALMKLVHGINIFVYFKFNKMFRQVLVGFFKKGFCFSKCIYRKWFVWKHQNIFLIDIIYEHIYGNFSSCFIYISISFWLIYWKSTLKRKIIFINLILIIHNCLCIIIKKLNLKNLEKISYILRV